MDIVEAVLTLIAVKAYTDDPISDEDVHTILEAGRLTGSASNVQPWHFIVIRDPEMRVELGNRWQPSRYLAQSPVAIAVFVEDNRGWGLMDGARAIQSMLLAALGLGIGSTWTSHPDFGDEVRDLLDVPDNLQFIGFVTLGYPAQPMGKGTKNRKPLKEIAHLEKFGQPYVEQ